MRSAMFIVVFKTRGNDAWHNSYKGQASSNSYFLLLQTTYIYSHFIFSLGAGIFLRIGWDIDIPFVPSFV